MAAARPRCQRVCSAPAPAHGQQHPPQHPPQRPRTNSYLSIASSGVATAAAVPAGARACAGVKQRPLRRRVGEECELPAPGPGGVRAAAPPPARLRVLLTQRPHAGRQPRHPLACQRCLHCCWRLDDKLQGDNRQRRCHTAAQHSTCTPSAPHDRPPCSRCVRTNSMAASNLAHVRCLLTPCRRS